MRHLGAAHVVAPTLALVFAACATAPPQPPLVGEQPATGAQLESASTDAEGGPRAPEPRPSPPASCGDLARPGVIRRSAVDRVVDAGLGRWLAGVDVERQLDRGRFVGWRIVRLYPGDPCYAQADVRVGDVVLTVNGRSIERPDAAHAVFQSLRGAPAVVVRLLRDGRERTVTFEITDR